jgi:hypothetical protein
LPKLQILFGYNLRDFENKYIQKVKNSHSWTCNELSILRLEFFNFISRQTFDFPVILDIMGSISLILPLPTFTGLIFYILFWFRAVFWHITFGKSKRRDLFGIIVLVSADSVCFFGILNDSHPNWKCIYDGFLNNLLPCNRTYVM